MGKILNIQQRKLALLHALCVSQRKVGGLRFIKLGRLTISFSVSKVYKPL